MKTGRPVNLFWKCVFSATLTLWWLLGAESTNHSFFPPHNICKASSIFYFPTVPYICSGQWFIYRSSFVATLLIKTRLRSQREASPGLSLWWFQAIWGGERWVWWSMLWHSARRRLAQVHHCPELGAHCPSPLQMFLPSCTPGSL